MTKKGYKPTERHKKNLRKNHSRYWLNKKRPEKTKKKIKNKLKGRHVSLKTEFKKGMKLSEEKRIKISLGKTGEKEFTGFREPLNKRIRILREYLKWRSSVLKRDNYHCQNCGKQEDLEAHHIIPLYKIKIMFGIKKLEDAKSCKELWDIGNGITYCKKCHIKLDKHRIISIKNSSCVATQTKCVSVQRGEQIGRL